MLKLVQALEAALNADIQQVDWMSPTTRKAAILKLEKIEDKIGYPDHWRDYTSLKIVRGDALANAYRSGEFELHRKLSRIGRPVDRAEWSVSPSVPNAYYDAQLNAITFPRPSCSRRCSINGRMTPRISEQSAPLLDTS
jgi:putative endopeptidase